MTHTDSNHTAKNGFSAKISLCKAIVNDCKPFATLCAISTLNMAKNRPFTYCKSQKPPKITRNWPIFGNETRFNPKKSKWGYQWQSVATDTRTETRYQTLHLL